MKNKKALILTTTFMFVIPLVSCTNEDKVYSLTLYNLNPTGGEVVGAGSYKYKESVTITSTSYEGYTLGGIYNEEHQLVTKETSYTFKMPKKDLTYSVSFKPVTYSVTLSCQDESKGRAMGSGSYEYGQEVTIIFVRTADYFFDGWYEGDQLISNRDVLQFEMPNRDLNYVARVKPSEGPIKEKELYYFGNYPQSKVTDEAELETLRPLVSTLPNSANPNSWTNYSWYISSKLYNNVAWYKDLDINNDSIYDYRAIYYTFYRPFNATFDSSTSNTYQDDHGYYTNTVFFFRYEPIEWMVLSNKDNEKFLVSNKIIDNNEYAFYSSKDLQNKTDYQGNHASVYPNNYKYSTLRTFLNTKFYDSAFTNEEKTLINTTTVDNSLYSSAYPSNPYICEDTNDKVFAPSSREMLLNDNGFHISPVYKDENKALLVTDYATAMGCYKNTGSQNKGGGAFYARTPEYNSSITIRAIYASGTANGYYLGIVTQGIVPAIKLANI